MEMEYKEKVLKRYAEGIKALYSLCFESKSEDDIWYYWNDLKSIADHLKHDRRQEIIEEEEEL